MSYTRQHLAEAARIIADSTRPRSSWSAARLADARARDGRLFFLGVGGSAANCSHAVNDFRKLAGYRGLRADRQCLGADGADERRRLGDRVRRAWLARQPTAASGHGVRLCRSAAAVSTRTSARTSSRAFQFAKEVGAGIVGIVGRDGGYTATVADACVIVPTVNPDDDHAARRGVPGGRVAPAASRIRRSRQPHTKWESTAVRRARSSSTATA